MTTLDDPYELAGTAAAALRDRLGAHRVAVVLGSGWAAAADDLGSVVGALPSHELPGTPAPTVVGHEGTVRSVRLAGPDGERARARDLGARRTCTRAIRRRPWSTWCEPR